MAYGIHPAWIKPPCLGFFNQLSAADQTFEIDDRWVWGFYEDSPPIFKKNTSNVIALNVLVESDEKLTPNSKSKAEFVENQKPITTSITVAPFISRRIEASTVSVAETKRSDIQGTSTTKPNKIIATNAPLAENRLLNSTQNIQITTDAITEVKPTDPTTILPETTTLDFCDPIPKPDFTAPGRRLSESQCMGYIWEMKNRIKLKEQDNICNTLKRWNINHAVGGRKTETGEFPHMGALGWKAAVGTWVFKCGSSLISANFVLTAAHCAKASPKDSSIADPIPKIVRLGDKLIVDIHNFFTFPTDANISRIIVHPDYNPPMQYNDIALMELEEPVEFTRLIQPACLWQSFFTGDIGHEATLTGWGVIKSGSLDISPELQAATVNVLDTKQCDKLLENSHNRNWKGFQDHQLCAGKLAGGVDSCQGDSGGPLQIKIPLPKDITDQQGSMHYVIGVIAFGVGCAHPNLPGVYTRVSSYLDWIEDNVWKNGHNRTYVKPPPTNVLSFSLR